MIVVRKSFVCGVFFSLSFACAVENPESKRGDSNGVSQAPAAISDEVVPPSSANGTAAEVNQTVADKASTPNSNEPMSTTQTNPASNNTGTIPNNNGMPKPVNSLVLIESKCENNSFTISINDNGSLSSQSNSAFPGCSNLAAALNGKKLPTGMSVATVEGGRNLQASCMASTLSLLIQGRVFPNSGAKPLSSVQACEELRDIINQQKI